MFDIIQSVFEKAPGGVIIRLPTIMVDGQAVRCAIKRVHTPEFAKGLGWLRLMQSFTPNIHRIEVHLSQENASIECPNDPHPLMVQAIWYVPKQYGSSEGIVIGERNFIEGCDESGEQAYRTVRAFLFPILQAEKRKRKNKP